MIKLLFGLLITVFTTFLGKKLTNKFSQKYEFYKAFEKFNSTALRNLNFKNGGISEFYGDDFGNEGFNSFVTKCILGNEEISVESILPKFLNESEKKEISDYFYEIGKHNFDAERDFLERNRL